MTHRLEISQHIIPILEPRGGLTTFAYWDVRAIFLGLKSSFVIHIFRYKILPESFPCFGLNFFPGSRFADSAAQDSWLIYTS